MHAAMTRQLNEQAGGSQFFITVAAASCSIQHQQLMLAGPEGRGQSLCTGSSCAEPHAALQLIADSLTLDDSNRNAVRPSKQEVRCWLAFITQHHVDARPSRGMLKQVSNLFTEINALKQQA